LVGNSRGHLPSKGKNVVRIIPKQLIGTLKDWSIQMKTAFKLASNIITNVNNVKRV
jgi:hypothetical protein